MLYSSSLSNKSEREVDQSWLLRRIVASSRCWIDGVVTVVSQVSSLEATMSHQNNADRSSIEIKDLLRKLHPAAGSNHKDRIRRLNKFRNYVQPPVRHFVFGR
jgi:hypothetical protein